MPDRPNIDVPPDLWEIVRDILQKHIPQYTVWAFGSRAKWTAKPYSDLDLAIITDKPLPLSTSAALKEDFSESNLPWRVDIIDWATTSAEFRGVIEKDKVVMQIAERDHKTKFGELVNFVSKKETINNLKLDNYISTENMMPDFCGIKTASSLPKSGSVTVFKKSDTLFSNIRTYFKKVWKAKYDGYCSNDVLVFRSRDENSLLPDYLYNICRWEKFTEFSVRTAKGVKMPRGDKKSLSQFHFHLPPLKKQRSISHILDTLDKKIELNRSINQTLEALAQAIFKSWFVDFEPTKAKIAALKQGQDPLRAAMCAISGKTDSELNQLPCENLEQLAATTALFPDAMVQSELGKIPKGWKVQPANTLANIGIGKTPPRKEPQWFTTDKNDYPWVSIKDMASGEVFQQYTSEFITQEAVSRFNIREIPSHTVLLSFKLTVGRVAITDKEMTTNEAIAHFKLPSNSVLSPEYLYIYLKNFDYSVLGSTSSIATAINSEMVRKIPIIVANNGLIEHFTKLVIPIFKKIRNTQNEISILRIIRDTLLPKLLSGELIIPADITDEKIL